MSGKRVRYELIVNCNAEIYHKVSATIGGLYSAEISIFSQEQDAFFLAKDYLELRNIYFFLFNSLLQFPFGWVFNY